MPESAVTPLQSAYEEVSAHLQLTQRELWRPLMRELLREGGGPAAGLGFLEAERARLVEQIRESIGKAKRASE